MLSLLLYLFGWIMFIVQALRLALLIVRVVHHYNIPIVIIVKMSLWNVVSEFKKMIVINSPAEFTLSPASGPNATLDNCFKVNPGDCTFRDIMKFTRIKYFV